MHVIRMVEDQLLFEARLADGSGIVAAKTPWGAVRHAMADGRPLTHEEFALLLGSVEWSGAEWRAYLEHFEPMALLEEKPSYKDRRLRDALALIVAKRLEIGPSSMLGDERIAPDPPRSWHSDLEALLAAGTTVQHLLNAYGLADPFFGIEDAGPFEGYPTLDCYDEDNIRDLGQLMGEMLTMVNPGAYVSRNVATPVLNTELRERPFVFEPLPVLANIDRWQRVGDGTVSYQTEDGTVVSGHDLMQCHMADDVCVRLWTEERGGEHGANSSPVYVCEVHAPGATAPIKGMDAPTWFLFNWFEQDAMVPAGVARFYPRSTAHEAWSWAANWWLNAAYRYV